MYNPKFHRFSISRFVQQESLHSVQAVLQEELDEHDGRTFLPRAHVSLFKQSMLHRTALRQYRPPSISEIETRVIDQPNPRWEPFYEATYKAVGAMAFRGSIMLKFKDRDFSGEHSGALHAAKVSHKQLDKNKPFVPHVTICRYDEDSVASMDQLYHDEAVLEQALSKSPLSIDLSPVKVSGAQGYRDHNRVLHTFQPRRIA